jgi:AraC-like DNA-binding protein
MLISSIRDMNKSLQSLRITLLNIGHVHLDKNWDYDNVVSPFTRLYYIKNGSARVYHHSQVFELKAGWLYLIPSFTYSRYKCDHKMEQLYIHFLEEVGTGLSIYNLRDFKYQLRADALTTLLFERLLVLNPNWSLLKEDPKVYDNYRSLSLMEARNNDMSTGSYLETSGILKILLAQFIEDKGAVVQSSAYKGNKITETLYYISEHLHKELTVQHLAERCHINTDYFSRLFKEQTGIRPLQFLQNKRIERAQILLSTTDDTLQNIADKVGLPNISYFSRLFTKLTKKTASAYRKERWSV